MDYFEWENSMFKRGMFLLIESLRTRRCFHRTTRPGGVKWNWTCCNLGIPSMEMIQGIIPPLVPLPSGYQIQGIWRNGFIPSVSNSRIERRIELPNAAWTFSGSHLHSSIVVRGIEGLNFGRFGMVNSRLWSQKQGMGLCSGFWFWQREWCWFLYSRGDG